MIKLIENLLVLKVYISSKHLATLQQNLNSFITLYVLDLTELRSPHKARGGYYLEKMELYAVIYFLVKVSIGAIHRDIFQGTKRFLTN